MTIDSRELEYFRTKIIGKYITPIMEQYNQEEQKYNELENRVKRMLKEAKR